jgi:predicted dehydrogenase
MNTLKCETRDVDTLPGSHTIDQALVLFGRPHSVTAFLRSNRGVESDTDDTFTVILQYSGVQSNLLVTIKTSIITPLKDQLTYFVRGTKGSYIKVLTIFISIP